MFKFMFNYCLYSIYLLILYFILYFILYLIKKKNDFDASINKKQNWGLICSFIRFILLLLDPFFYLFSFGFVVGLVVSLFKVIKNIVKLYC
jgi:hypothetical protein